MGVTIKEMNQILRSFAGWEGKEKKIKRKNEELRRKLRDLSEGQIKEDIEAEIRISEEFLSLHMKQYAVIMGLMERHLTDDEYEVIKLRHMHRMQWNLVARQAHMSRSCCFRTESRGMERLRDAWEKYLETEAEKGEG